MKKIELNESCFGQDVLIDDESLFVHEFDNRDPKKIDSLKDDLLNTLCKLKERFGMNDWYQLAEMVVTISEEYDYSVEESNEGTSCEQCGNYNWNYIYKTKEHDKES